MSGFRDEVRICLNCKYWGQEIYNWNGCRPCQKEDGRFFVGGGDNNDGLYTQPEFGCVEFERRVDSQ